MSLDHPGRPRPWRFNPWIFFPVLFLPAVLAVLLFVVPIGKTGMAISIAAGLAGSVGAGMFCGHHLYIGYRNLTPGVKTAVGVVSLIGCVGVTLAMFLGVLVGLVWWLGRAPPVP